MGENNATNQNVDAKSQDGANKLTGWHVLAILVGLFGVVFAVNGYFIYKAYATNSGEIGHAYLEGLKFNEKLDAKAKQSELGWNMELGFERGAGGDALFIATLKDKNGAAVSGANITGKVWRVVENKDDKDLVFTESNAGKYTAHVSKLGPGKWSFKSDAVKGDLPKFSVETQLSIR
jgi:nitrogen fixation protein FixH